MPNSVLTISNDQSAIYAYTVFNTSKSSPHYKTIMKCVDFKKYVTHKLIISTATNSYEYTFLRLAYSKPTTSVYNDSWSMTGNSWTTSLDTGKAIKHDIDTLIDGAKSQSIVGTSLMDVLPEIFNNINNSISFKLDNSVIERNDNYIHLFLEKIYEADPVLLISLCICPREYFNVENYGEYFNHFIQIIKTISEKIKNINYVNKYHLEKTVLIDIAKIFINTIRTDYLFLSTDVLLQMLNFIVDVRITNNAACGNPLHYEVTNTSDEITIVGKEVKDTNSDEFRTKQMAIYDTSTFYNPYALVELVQYLNLKLISENRKPIKLNLIGTTTEMYSYVQRNDHDNEIRPGVMQQLINFNWINDGFDDLPRVYKTSFSSTVKYDHMAKILTKKQKNLFVKSTIDNLNNIMLEDNDFIVNNPKYSYGVSILKEMLCSLIGEDIIEKDRTPLDIVINNFKTDEPRAAMLIKIYTSTRDREKLASFILDYITDDEIRLDKTFELINAYIQINNQFNVLWLNKHKDVIVDGLRIKYKLSDKISTDQLYAFYLFTHCPEFVKKDFITNVTDSLVKNKNTKISALNSIIDGFFKQKTSAVLEFLNELQSPLMKDLFIGIYNLKASQQLLIFEMSDDISKSTEVEELNRNAIKLAEAKSIHYASCEQLIETAYKSTNSFRSKIIGILKENVVSTVFGGNSKKKINNDARIALFADLLRALSKSFLTVEEQCDIVNQYDTSRYDPILPYRMEDMSGVMKAISLVPECPPEITMFFTEKYLQEH